MHSTNYWDLCEEYSVIQAALLIVDEDPATLQHVVEQNSPDFRPHGFDAVYSALQKAVSAGSLEASIRHSIISQGCLQAIAEEYASFSQNNTEILTANNGTSYIYSLAPDWHLTTIQKADLIKWLRARNFYCNFFTPVENITISQPSEEQPFCTPKLLAALDAWEAVRSNNGALKGNTPKQAIQKWLRQNAANYGLVNSKGRPNELAIEEIAKVVNWSPKGGAPRTPSK